MIDIGFLLSGLEDNSDPNVTDAEERLRTLLNSRPEYAQALSDALPGLGASGRARAVSLLGPYVGDSRELAELLASVHLEDESDEVRRNVATALHNGTRSVLVRKELLSAARTDTSQSVRVAATNSLRSCADLPEVRAVLDELVVDNRPDVRRAARSSLGAPEVFDRLDPSSGESLRLRVVPSDKERQFILGLVGEITEAIRALRDLGVTDEQEAILSDHIEPATETIRRLATLTEATPEDAQIRRQEGTIEAAKAHGVVTALTAIEPQNSQSRLYGKLGEFFGGAVGAYLNSQT